jgi:UV DNA damage endonuclease
MLPRRIGYACINMQLSNPKEYGGAPRGTKKITTNRSMIKRTFLAEGTSYASELGLQNVKDLYKILQWNEENGFNFFRLSSNLFPWASEYNWDQLPNIESICEWLGRSGDFAKKHGHRITAHPGPFNKLTSGDERIIGNTIKDLSIHGWTFDQMGLPRTPWAKINIHVGASYGDKQKACDNFCRNFERLPDSVKSRLTVENDDKASLYSTKELYELIFSRIGIPIVHDIHHHGFCDGGLSQEEAISLAASTWGDVVPVIHYSESRPKEQGDPKIKPQAHSDYVYDYIETYGHEIDCMIEAKHKELAVIKWLELHR